jgi:hypothetical protein
MATPDSETHTTVGATPARQGRIGRQVIWVLVISTLLAAIVLLVAWVWRADELARVERNNGRVMTPAHEFNAPAPAPATQQK